MAGVYYPVVNVPRTRAPRRGLINIRHGVAGLATYVQSPAYQGSNGLGADAPSVASIAQAAAQAAAQIAQQRYGTPATQSVIQQIPYASPNVPPTPQHRWLPWVIGGGAVFLLGGVALFATRRRRK